MTSFGSFMRQALLAACITLPLPTFAAPVAQYDATSGAVILSGLSEAEQSEAMLIEDALRLQVANLDTERGMPVRLNELGADIVIMPHFALRAGTEYVLNLDLAETSYDLGISLPETEVTIPKLIGFAPSQAVIPANTLRLYLQFSEPMARGQLREAITLIQSDGDAVPSPFLNLETELWDPSQTRATLLLDPGRIKQGVGPNRQAGAPLTSGESYQLIVSESMQSAAGTPLGTDVTLALRVGPSERRAIDPMNWQILTPPAGSHASLTIAFDRIMDSGAVLRLLRVQDSARNDLRGHVSSDAGGWAFAPMEAWQAGEYYLIVDPELEDVSGNTIAAPFDVASGTIGATVPEASITIQISKN
jgi:hypothetical protein